MIDHTGYCSLCHRDAADCNRADRAHCRNAGAAVSGRTAAVDDGDSIRAGMEKLRAEREARLFKCTCEWRVGPRGEVIPVTVASCPVHSVEPIKWHTNFGDEIEARAEGDE